MRHGTAAGPDIDPEQGLSALGRDEISRLAERLASRGIQFSRIFHSNKTRAKQTAELMMRGVSPNADVSLRAGLSPNDDPQIVMDEMASWSSDTLAVSHLPLVPGLLAIIPGVGSASMRINFVPGTIVCIEKAGDKQERDWKLSWSESP